MPYRQVCGHEMEKRRIPIVPPSRTAGNGFPVNALEQPIDVTGKDLNPHVEAFNWPLTGPYCASSSDIFCWPYRARTEARAVDDRVSAVNDMFQNESDWTMFKSPDRISDLPCAAF